MKKMKKILAMLLALTMVLGMSLTSMAAETASTTTSKMLTAEPTETDFVTATVNGVAKNAVVTAYKVVEAKYDPTDNTGFLRYDKVAGDFSIADPEKLTPEEVTTIAAAITNGDLSLDTTKYIKSMNNTSDGTYTADLTAGYWIVLVEDTVKVYNPILIGVYYSSKNNSNTIEGGIVDSTSSWMIETSEVYAKSYEPEIHKDANSATWNLGDDVTYTVKTIVPDYSDAYDVTSANDIKYEIKDTVTGDELSIKTDTILVSVTNGTITKGTDYELVNTSATGYTINIFDSWLMANPKKELVITYNATVTGAYYANDTSEGANTSHDNTVTLTYTNELGAPTQEDPKVKIATATESVYTFKVENVITKTGEGADAAKLAGAEFTIYTDAACTTKYLTNPMHRNGKVTSNADGKINIYGLDANVDYYIRETLAPTGYSLNTDIFKITITTTETKEIDKADTITNPTISVVNTSKNNEAATTIPNTKLVSLPSTGGIGTTIFTVAGCGIMIAAAFFFFASRKRENN